jgi:hypothetical protein
LTFAPISDATVAEAEPVGAEIKSDGSFVVPNGAIAGRHRLMYYAPAVDQGEAQEWDGKGKPPETKKSPYDGMKVQPEEVEVKDGGTELTLELVPRTAG